MSGRQLPGRPSASRQVRVVPVRRSGALDCAALARILLALACRSASEQVPDTHPPGGPGAGSGESEGVS